MISKERLVEIIEQHNPMCVSGPELADRILKAIESEGQEPLAVLADRKGFFIRYIAFAFSKWIIWINGDKNPIREQFCDLTYAACESKARAYLESLPDAK